MTFHVIYNRGFRFSIDSPHSIIRCIILRVRNATDQSGLITGTQRVFSVKNVRFDIEKPPNHVFKFYELKAMIRPIPWVTDVEESMILQRRQQRQQV